MGSLLLVGRLASYSELDKAVIRFGTLKQGDLAEAEVVPYVHWLRSYATK